MADWSLSSLQLKPIKIGAHVVRHARSTAFQLAEATVTGPMERAILADLRHLRAPPSCARRRSTPKLNENGMAGLRAALKNNTIKPDHGGLEA